MCLINVDGRGGVDEEFSKADGAQHGEDMM